MILAEYGRRALPFGGLYSIAGLIEYAIPGAILGTIYKRGPVTPG